MSILINKNTRVVVQGITGRDGGFHAGKMKEYGTQVVAGTSPGKGGTFVNGVPDLTPYMKRYDLCRPTHPSSLYQPHLPAML